MIKGKVRIELTAENILKLVSDFDIFRYFMPNKKWKINEVTNSPFREDKNPSLLIGNKNGYLSFVDFGDSSKHGDAFEFVKALHGCTYDEALRIVDKELGLGICDTSNVGEYKKIVSEYKQPEEDTEKHTVMIQVITRRFTNSELQYWEKYGITKEELIAEHVYSIDKIFLNRKRFPVKNDELRFGYLYEGRYWKLYFLDRGKKHKWLSNVPLTILDGKEAIKDCDVAFITKSKKDKILLKKIHPHVTATQNESIGCFSPENVEYIKANSKRQVILYDSDDPGVQSCQQITKLFGFEYCNPPRKYLPEVKDFSDMAMKYSLEEVEKFIKGKLLLK